MAKLTPVQEKALGYIIEYRAVHEISPSFREMAKNFKCSIGTMQVAVSALIKLGFLKHKDGIPRSFVPTGLHIKDDGKVKA